MKSNKQKPCLCLIQVCLSELIEGYQPDNKKYIRMNTNVNMVFLLYQILRCVDNDQIGLYSRSKNVASFIVNKFANEDNSLKT